MRILKWLLIFVPPDLLNSMMTNGLQWYPSSIFETKDISWQGLLIFDRCSWIVALHGNIPYNLNTISRKWLNCLVPFFDMFRRFHKKQQHHSTTPTPSQKEDGDTLSSSGYCSTIDNGQRSQTLVQHNHQNKVLELKKYDYISFCRWAYFFLVSPLLRQLSKAKFRDRSVTSCHFAWFHVGFLTLRFNLQLKIMFISLAMLIMKNTCPSCCVSLITLGCRSHIFFWKKPM